MFPTKDKITGHGWKGNAGGGDRAQRQRRLITRRLQPPSRLCDSRSDRKMFNGGFSLVRTTHQQTLNMFQHRVCCCWSNETSSGGKCSQQPEILPSQTRKRTLIRAMLIKVRISSSSKRWLCVHMCVVLILKAWILCILNQSNVLVCRRIFKAI